jgi:tRNA threonylcarbamoyladenosine biosynthesis protein TsaB
LAARHVDSTEHQILIPVMDARRMEVYAAVYTNDLQELEPANPLILDEMSFAAYQEKNALIFGHGAQKFMDSYPNPSFTFNLENPSPEAIHMGQLAYEAYLNKKFENIVTIEPDYLKEYMGQKPQKKYI